MLHKSLELLTPNWRTPRNVKACATLRFGGVSSAPFESLNLSDRVGDQPIDVSRNRHALMQHLELDAEPLWLNQLHGTRVIDAQQYRPCTEADGIVSSIPRAVCAVTTADCLPILICDQAGERVAALHAGWRGLVAGVLESGIAAMRTPPTRLQAWVGPSISSRVYEVGEEVRDAFLHSFGPVSAAFRTSRAEHWYADLPWLADFMLRQQGLTKISCCGHCTYSEPKSFFSFRRDGNTGRMASLIWLD